MFMNALSEVLLSTRQQAGSNASAQASPAVGASVESPETAAPASTASGSAASTPMYLAELQQMREMGLNDTEINLQALMITNGDVEAAVNLVFSGMNN
jgi:UBA/TS-N domain